MIVHIHFTYDCFSGKTWQQAHSYRWSRQLELAKPGTRSSIRAMPMAVPEQATDAEIDALVAEFMDELGRYCSLDSYMFCGDMHECIACIYSNNHPENSDPILDGYLATLQALRETNDEDEC